VYSDGGFSLYDSQDNYSFESDGGKHEIIWIDYVSMTNQWFTVNKQGMLETWDLGSLKPTTLLRVLSPPTETPGTVEIIERGICDSAELKRINLYAIGTSEKKLYLIDINKRAIFKEILFVHGINKVKYLDAYSMMIVSGYSRNVPVYELVIKHNEINRLCILQGHNSNVITIEVVENSPTLITVDDIPILKIWDVRTFKCIQTIEFKLTSGISDVFAIPSHHKFAFVSSRLNIVEMHPFYGDKYHNLLDPENSQLLIADHVYDPKRKLFLAITNKCMIEISAETGTVQRILTNLFNSEVEDELAKCELIGDQSILIASNLQGKIIFQDMLLNKSIVEAQSSKKELLSINFDAENHMLIVAGYDNSIKLYYDDVNFVFNDRTQLRFASTKVAQVTPCSIIYGIEKKSTHRFFDYSLKFDVMFSGFAQRICVFSIDTFKLIGVLQFAPEYEICSMKLMKSSGILIVTFLTGEIIILKIHKRTYGKIEFNTMLTMNINDMRLKAIYDAEKVRRLHNALARFLQSLGILSTNISPYEIQEPRPDTLTPKFPRLIFKEDGQILLYLGTSQAFMFKFVLTDYLAPKLAEYRDKDGFIQVKTMFNLGKRVITNYADQEKFIPALITHIDLKELSNTRTNIAYSTLYKSKLTDLRTFKVFYINSTPLIQVCLKSTHLLILNEAMQPLSKVCINHPLPLFWRLKLKKDTETTSKVGELRKYSIAFTGTHAADEHDLHQIETIKKLLFAENSLAAPEIYQLTQDLSNLEERFDKQKLQIMKDCYDPKDMIYKKLKADNFRDLAGPNLHQLERYRAFLEPNGPETLIENQRLKDAALAEFDINVKTGLKNRLKRGSIDYNILPTGPIQSKINEAIKAEDVMRESQLTLKKNYMNSLSGLSNFAVDYFIRPKKSNNKKLLPDKVGNLALNTSSGQREPTQIESGNTSPTKKEISMNAKRIKLFEPASGATLTDSSNLINLKIGATDSQSLSLNSKKFDSEVRITSPKKPERNLTSLPGELAVEVPTTTITPKPVPKMSSTTNSFFIRPSVKHKKKSGPKHTDTFQPMNIEENELGLADRLMTPQSTANIKSVANLTHSTGYGLRTTASNLGKTSLPHHPLYNPNPTEHPTATLERFLVETKKQRIRSHSIGASFELRKTDSFVVYKDKSFSNFLKNIDEQKKKAKFNKLSGKNSLSSSFYTAKDHLHY